MSGLSQIIISASIPVILLFALLPPPVSAQQKRRPYSPVVKAYLTGLDEELNELEYQLRRQEISRPDYERAKHRLAILRRFVERRAAESREDIVPEYQVLAEDELGALGLDRELKTAELVAGAKLEGLWKVAGIQFGGARNLTRFLVLERLPPAETPNGGGRESRPGKPVDPREVIETIVVQGERPLLAAPPPPPPVAPDSPATKTADQSSSAETRSEIVAAVARQPRLQSPRILHIYLPEYTEKARDKKIEGEVVVRALFGRDGRVREAKVEKGLGFGLDDRAVEATRRIGYFPAQLEGKEVDARVQIVFEFKPEKVSVYVGAAEQSAGAKGERF
jgi:TonB family protein